MQAVFTGTDPTGTVPGCRGQRAGRGLQTGLKAAGRTGPPDPGTVTGGRIPGSPALPRTGGGTARCQTGHPVRWPWS